MDIIKWIATYLALRTLLIKEAQQVKTHRLRLFTDGGFSYIFQMEYNANLCSLRQQDLQPNRPCYP